jgi:hypothetical protein
VKYMAEGNVVGTRRWRLGWLAGSESGLSRSSHPSLVGVEELDARKTTESVVAPDSIRRNDPCRQARFVPITHYNQTRIRTSSVGRVLVTVLSLSRESSSKPDQVVAALTSGNSNIELALNRFSFSRIELAF